MEGCIVVFPNGQINAETDRETSFFKTEDILTDELLDDQSAITVMYADRSSVIYRKHKVKILDKIDPFTWFTFVKELTTEENEIRQLQSDVAYIAMMTGVDL